MPRLATKNSSPNGAGGLVFEATLWSAAEKLKGNMERIRLKFEPILATDFQAGEAIAGNEL